MNTPKVDVSFAPTKVFSEKFPQEAEEQLARFTQATWAQRIAPAPQQAVELPAAQPKQQSDEKLVIYVTAAVLLLAAAGFLYYQYGSRS